MSAQTVFLVILLATAASAEDRMLGFNTELEECEQGDDWTAYKGSCYYTPKNTSRLSNWFQSEITCKEMGGYLTTVDGYDENKFLNAFGLCQNFWIGLVNVDPSNRWYNQGYRWMMNGSSVSYSRLHGSNYAYRDCVYMHGNSYWYNDYCQDRLNFVCKSDSASLSSEPAASIYQCPSGWLRYEDQCFFVSSKRANYFNAQMSCEDKNATVATINSVEEQTLLTIQLQCNIPVWIGLELTRPCHSNSNQSSCFMWMDRQPVQYTKWARNNPRGGSSYECVYSLGGWYNTDCYREFQFLCKKPATRI